LIKACIKVS